MGSLLRKLFGIKAQSQPELLKGRRQTPRVKSYSAESGYVYEYVYDGYRDVSGERQYVFTASGNRKLWFTISVRVPFTAFEAWERANTRTLNDAERYAVAKLALFAAFDQRPSPADMIEPVVADEASVAALLESIDL